MRADVPKRMLLVSLLLSLTVLLPARVYAQEATFAGAITDSTGSVLPGVTITAVHEASGNIFTVVTDRPVEPRIGREPQSNAHFGQPAANSNAQYFPRVLQFGVRATF